jgi:hypothetical protein
MIIYSVSITLLSRIESEWLAWMKGVHVPDVMRTGCFTHCSMSKVLEPPGDEVTYQLQYSCNSLDDYQRYRDTYAPGLQKEHSEKFAGAFRGSRQILEEVFRM